MSNVIVRDNDDLLGYYSDLRQYLRETLVEYAGNSQWEDVKDMADLLLDLDDYVDERGLLIISANNGMGNTVRKYEGEK